MKTLIAIVAALTAVLLIAPANAEEVGIPKPTAAAKTIKELQQERIGILKEMVDTATALFRSGRASTEEVCEAWGLLLKAETGAAEKESDRIKLLKSAIEAMNECEKIAQARKESARGTHLAVLKIKEQRLEMEIALEQSKTKVAQGAE